jgi:CTP:molybdopterin cytidylyltransferase MocA
VTQNDANGAGRIGAGRIGADRIGAGRIGAVIPAAGRSRRMGRSKPLLALGETDFLGTLLRKLRDPAVGAAPVAVVYRRDDSALAARLEGEGLGGTLRAVPVTPDAGDMLHSVRTGAAALGLVEGAPAGGTTDNEVGPARQAGDEVGGQAVLPAGLLVWPVDAPAVAPSTVQAVARAARQTPDAVVRPVHRGEPGHPIYVPAALLTREDPAFEGGLRGLIQRAVDQRRCALRDVPVEDPDCRLNANTPAQYWALAQRQRSP